VASWLGVENPARAPAPDSQHLPRRGAGVGDGDRVFDNLDTRDSISADRGETSLKLQSLPGGACHMDGLPGVLFCQHRTCRGHHRTPTGPPQDHPLETTPGATRAMRGLAAVALLFICSPPPWLCCLARDCSTVALFLGGTGSTGSITGGWAAGQHRRHGRQAGGSLLSDSCGVEFNGLGCMAGTCV
jgi:hypothetical protein